MVILKDEKVARNFWKLAKVIELLNGADGITRAALINVAAENGPPKIMQRSIKQLIPMDHSGETPAISKPSYKDPTHVPTNSESVNSSEH